MLTMPVAQSIRPVIVCTALGVGLISRRITDVIQLLAIAAIAVLVVRPMDLYGAGFQLSFIIVLTLILLTRPVIRFIDSLEDEDMRVARSFQPRTPWRLRREWLWRWGVGFVVAAVIGWIAAIPLVAFHFEQFNLWTIPFTLLLSPFAMLAITAGFAKLILTAICPPLATTWAALAIGPAWMLRHAVALLAKVPGADLPVGSPVMWLSVIFYACLFIPLIAWNNRRARWCARCAPLGGFAALLLLPIFAKHFVDGPASNGVKITLLDVGAGQCAVAEAGGGQTIILDAGSSTLSDPYRSCISPFLRHEGCASVNELWLSHGDFDHIGAARQLVPGYRVKEVIASPHLRRLAHESQPCEALLATLDQTHHSPRVVVAGDHISAGAVQIQVLWPPPQSNFNTNNTGIVLRLTCAGRSILFPADIQDLAERELLKHPESLRSDVLVAPHHGSAEKTTPEFVAAVHPKAIVSSNNSTLSMKQREFDADVNGLPSYRTSQYGAITIEVTGNGTIEISSYLKGTLLELKH
jgi:competence protein ComEC